MLHNVQYVMHMNAFRTRYTRPHQWSTEVQWGLSVLLKDTQSIHVLKRERNKKWSQYNVPSGEGNLLLSHHLEHSLLRGKGLLIKRFARLLEKFGLGSIVPENRAKKNSFAFVFALCINDTRKLHRSIFRRKFAFALCTHFKSTSSSGWWSMVSSNFCPNSLKNLPLMKILMSYKSWTQSKRLVGIMRLGEASMPITSYFVLLRCYAPLFTCEILLTDKTWN